MTVHAPACCTHLQVELAYCLMMAAAAQAGKVVKEGEGGDVGAGG